MKLNELFPHEAAIEIEDLILDSRTKTQNGMFFCISGLTSDAHQFAQQAVYNGCVAVVHSKDLVKQDGIEYILVDDVMDTLHEISNIFFDYPSHKLRIHGVTGTNGKSTVTKALYDLLSHMGVSAGYIGTISIEYKDVYIEPSFTTPDIVTLQRILHDMVQKGVSDVCLEVSSQGLDLRRVDALKFEDVSFTNLSHEHLDYHKTMDAYFEAKKRLFDLCDDQTLRILNNDDSYARRLNDPSYPVMTYAIDSEADLVASDIVMDNQKTQFTLHYKENTYLVETNFVAQFNVLNTLNIIAIMIHCDFDLDQIIAGLKQIKNVEGRLTPIELGQDFSVYADYAHTPDGIELVMRFAQSIVQEGSKVITLLGATGSRDFEKRPIIGQLASSISDWVIFTEDDRHYEDPKIITEDMIKGAQRSNYEVILDRQKAIEKAVMMAKSGDIILMLGKGEEDYMQQNGVHVPWAGDHMIAKAAIERKLGK